MQPIDQFPSEFSPSAQGSSDNSHRIDDSHPSFHLETVAMFWNPNINLPFSRPQSPAPNGRHAQVETGF